jgi:hypothetical protein
MIRRLTSRAIRATGRSTGSRCGSRLGNWNAISRTTTGQTGEMSGQGAVGSARLRVMNASAAYWNISRKKDMSTVCVNPMRCSPSRTPPGMTPGNWA